MEAMHRIWLDMGRKAAAFAVAGEGGDEAAQSGYSTIR